MSDKTEYNFTPFVALQGAQMLFVAFGALVLVPILTGLDPSVALFTAGIGTLIFQIVTKGKVPVFLASSFAFIAPIIFSVQTWGLAATTGGLAAAGLVYVAISFAIRAFGSDWLHRAFPPIVTGPVIMVIGLALAGVAVNMATGVAGDNQIFPKGASLLLATITLLAVLGAALLGTGFMRILSIFAGIAVGYIAALIIGPILGVEFVSFASVSEASWFAFPNFVAPSFELAAILFMLPVAIAPSIEHFGDIMAISNVAKKDYLKEPGVKNTMLGDGLATFAAGLFGGPPNTTYSEVTGAVTLTKQFNPAIMTWAAIFAILMAFIGKLGGLLGTIPMPVMGGVMVLMFGMIISIGASTLAKVENLTDPRNMAIASIILVIGVGGLTVDFGGGVVLGGIGLAGIVGVLANLLLPQSAED